MEAITTEDGLHVRFAVPSAGSFFDELHEINNLPTDHAIELFRGNYILERWIAGEGGGLRRLGDHLGRNVRLCREKPGGEAPQANRLS